MAKLNTPGTPKRGRGRPPKNQILISQLQKAASSPAPQASATPVRGGPSRTRSSLGSEAIPVATTPVASKSPARQGKKLHWTQKIKQELGLEGTPVATKSPGRPHKKLHWTQKLKQDLEQSRAENETKEEAASADVETSKRGRGRGRPPKTPVKEDLPSAETKDTETTSNAEEEDTVIVQAGEGDSTKLSEPPKRGRGRPKKILPESSTPADNAEAEPEPEEYEASSSEEVPRTIAELASAQKRSRGRPKKEQPEAVEASTQTVESTYPEAAASEDVSTVAPKARGRPPKKGKGLAGPVEPAPHTSKEDNEQDDDNTTAAGEDAIRVASAVGELFEESSGIHDQVEAATVQPTKRGRRRPKKESASKTEEEPVSHNGTTMANSLDEKIQAGGKRKAALASATNEDVQSKKLKNAAGQGITPEQARSIAPIAPMAPMHAPIHGYVGHRSSIGDGFDLSAENLGDEIFNAIEKHKAEATPTPFEVRRGRSAHHRRTPAVSEPMTGVETEQDAFVQAVHNARGRDDGEADDEGDGGTDPEHEEKIREKKSKSREVSAALEEDEDMPDVDEESAFLSGGGPNAEVRYEDAFGRGFTGGPPGLN